MGFLSKLLGTQTKVMPVRVDDSNFDQEVTRSELPVVVDFWSPSCGPCMQLEPVMVDLATAYEGRVKVVEVNVVGAQRVAEQLPEEPHIVTEGLVGVAHVGRRHPP